MSNLSVDLAQLVQSVGSALQDGNISNAERNSLISQLFSILIKNLIR